MRPLVFRVLLLLFLCLAATGQTTGTLRGVVRDPSFRVVPGAKVVVVEQGTNLSRGINADGEGEFVLPALPVGDYRLEIAANGFKKYVHRDLEVRLGHVVVMDVVLELGAAGEVVNRWRRTAG